MRVGCNALAARCKGSVGRDCPRRGTYFSVAQKSKQKRAPYVPAFGRCPKVPCATRNGRACANSLRCASLRQAQAFIARCSVARPVPKGVVSQKQQQKQHQLQPRARRPAFAPLLPCRASQQWREQIRGCLGEASSASPLHCEKRREPRDSGARQSGQKYRALFGSFLCLFKERNCPAGGSPGGQLNPQDVSGCCNPPHTTRARE